MSLSWSPRLFSRIDRWSGAVEDLMVHESTDICIEGYPRSGNSFFYRVFVHHNPGLSVAHHMHLPFQVRRATEFGVPLVILLRHPIDSVTSNVVSGPGLSVHAALLAYCLFYREVVRCRAHALIAPFEITVSEPDRVIRGANALFGTHFAHAPLDAALESEISHSLVQHHERRGGPPNLVPVPTESKNAAKAGVRPAVAASPLYPTAERLYRECLGISSLAGSTTPPASA